MSKGSWQRKESEDGAISKRDVAKNDQQEKRKARVQVMGVAEVRAKTELVEANGLMAHSPQIREGKDDDDPGADPGFEMGGEFSPPQSEKSEKGGSHFTSPGSVPVTVILY